MIYGKKVKVTIMDIDRHGRLVAILFLDQSDINSEMVKAGYAWAYREYLHEPYASEYIDAENEARARKLGLWQQANPQPPWEFRKQLRSGR